MDALRMICAESTVFLRCEAIGAGYDDAALRRALRAGVLHRVRHGAYIFSEAWGSADDRRKHLIRCHAVRRTARVKGVLSHISAVAAWGLPLWELPLEDVHVTRFDRRAGRREAGLRQHRGILLPEDVTSVDGNPVTTAARTAVDLCATTDVEHALPVVSEMLRLALVTPDDLVKASDAQARVPGTLTVGLTLSLADRRLESIGECRSWHMFFLNSLPMPIPQYEVVDAHGVVVARVDFAWPELGLFVEFDGKEKYVKFRKEGESVVDAVLREKKREELICRITGWRCLRLTWADLYYPEKTCRLIRSMFRATAA